MTPPGGLPPAAPGLRKLKDRVVPDPPEMDPDERGRTPGFVLVLLAVAALVMGTTLTVNAVADPYGTLGTHLFPTVVTSDRTVKADRIEQLTAPPQLVVLGTSRAMRYEPAYLEAKTSLRTFNAGVNGIGGTADAWAMSRFIHETWPQSAPEYLWLLDVESFVPFEIGARTTAEPRLARFIAHGGLAEGPGGFVRALWRAREVLLSLDTAYDSARVLLRRDEAAVRESRYRRRILADGVLTPRAWSAAEWRRRWPQSVARYSALHDGIYESLDATAQGYFERTLAFMNEQRRVPVVVLTPISPDLHRILAPLGWDDRHEEVLTYLRSLQGRYDFVILDMTDPRVFGFDRHEWYDGVHMTTVNTRRAVDYIIRQTGGWPPAQPPGDGR